MDSQSKPLVYAALGGTAAGVLVGLLGRTSLLSPTPRESPNEAVARLLTRSGGFVLLGGIGLAVYAEQEDWRPVALGAIGAGTLLFVSGLTMSKEPYYPSLPPQVGTAPSAPIPAKVISETPA